MLKRIYLILILILFVSCNQIKNDDSDKPNLNQIKDTNKESEIFKFSIPDTISLGKHIGRVVEYNKEKEFKKDYLLSVIVDNQYEESKIKKDTFSDGTLKPFFGINGFKLGTQKVKLTIEEQVLEIIQNEKDSVLRIMKAHHPYEFLITVVKEKFTSDLEKELLKEMYKSQ